VGGECAKQDNAEAFKTAYNSGRSATRADIIGWGVVGAGIVRAAAVGNLNTKRSKKYGYTRNSGRQGGEYVFDPTGKTQDQCRGF
jgi:hypothetical protein